MASLGDTWHIYDINNCASKGESVFTKVRRGRWAGAEVHTGVFSIADGMNAVSRVILRQWKRCLGFSVFASSDHIEAKFGTLLV